MVEKDYAIYAYASPENRLLSVVTLTSELMPHAYRERITAWDATSPNVGDRYPLGAWDYAERVN